MTDIARQRLADATRSWRETPGDLTARTHLARMLHRFAAIAGAEQRDAIAAMVRDPDIDPGQFESSGWVVLASEFPDGPEATARWIETNDLAIGLLEEAQVTDTAAERQLTAVRRWLLLDRRAADFPRTAAALVRQAAINGGAWPFGDDERTALVVDPAFTPAFLPPRPGGLAADYTGTVTRAVAAQYTSWPYPIWQRSNAQPAKTLRETLAGTGPTPPHLPARPKILIAGCGTGREASMVARTVPEGEVVAIELSEESLALARDRCAGQANLRFLRHDLHAVADLGEQFDYIACSGVLHHLPDPEAGWAALVDVLKPGGAMFVALYSRLARLTVKAAQLRLGELLDQPVSDDLIREARRRLIANPVPGICNSRDFFSTPGTHDLLFHVHEDAFDVPRIARALDTLKLRLLRFQLPDMESIAAYHAFAQIDPLQRDTTAWHEFEKRNPDTFGGMYKFTAMKPA